MFGFKTLVFVSVSCGFVESACPLRWIPYGESCYLFSHDTEEWIGALDVCREIGGQLVEIDDFDENHFIVTQARKRGGDGFWIALSDRDEEGTYVWMDSKVPLMPGDFTYWHSRQPDNNNGLENCVNLEDSFNMEWNDLTCHALQNYICERPNEDIDNVG